MHRTRLGLIFFAIAAMILASSSNLFAQQTRTWVSPVGTDSGSCGAYSSPCLTFSGALNSTNTASGGVISVQAPGDFGPVTITQSVTIDAGGMYAGILASSTGISINITAGETVILRGLSIDGGGSGLTGVDFSSSGGTLFVEKCAISNLSNYGISFEPTGTSQLFVSDTTIRNVAPGSTSNLFAGISLSASGGAIKSTVSIDNTRVEGCVTGLSAAKAFIKAIVSRSVLSGNSLRGIYVQGNSLVSVESCVLGNNVKQGILVNAGGGIVVISNNTIVNNGSGMVISAGSIVSTGGNCVAQDGGTPGYPTTTIPRE